MTNEKVKENIWGLKPQLLIHLPKCSVLSKSSKPPKFSFVNFTITPLQYYVLQNKKECLEKCQIEMISTGFIAVHNLLEDEMHLGTCLHRSNAVQRVIFVDVVVPSHLSPLKQRESQCCEFRLLPRDQSQSSEGSVIVPQRDQLSMLMTIWLVCPIWKSVSFNP